MQPAGPEATETPGRAAWGLLLLMSGLNVLNFVDRTLIASLAPLLIEDLALSRAEIGLLAGFGFVFFYTFVGLFLGLAADRWRRIPLLATGLALWSVMTAISGWARSFAGLAWPRLFVGVGEATLTPAALSMLGDAFPRRRLGLASSVYYAGIPIGTAVSLFASGVMAPRFGWRACFVGLGAVGLLALVPLLLLREPARGGTSAAARPPGWRELARVVTQAVLGRPALAALLVGGSLLCFGSASAMHTMTWLVHERGFAFADAAFKSGLMAVAAGILGNLAGGFFGDWMARRRPDGRIWSLIVMTAIFLPIGWLFYSLSPASPLFYVCWFLTSAGMTTWFGPFFAAVQELSPQDARSSLIAFAVLTINLLGVGPGPLVTGLLGDARTLTFGLQVSLGVFATAILPLAFAGRRLRTQGATR